MWRDFNEGARLDWDRGARGLDDVDLGCATIVGRGPAKVLVEAGYETEFYDNLTHAFRLRHAALLAHCATRPAARIGLLSVSRGRILSGSTDY